MFSFFKKKDSKIELINKWQSYCQEIGLTEGQILGLAYFNAAIPTVLAFVNKDKNFINPLYGIVNDIGKESSKEAYIFELYRVFYFNAKSRNEEILPIISENVNYSFYEKDNIYLDHFESNSGMLMNSRLSVLLIQELGDILSENKINLNNAFELGHYHSNYFLKSHTNGFNFASALIISNILPQYIAAAIDIFPLKNEAILNDDFWLFSKIFATVLKDSSENEEFKEWLWFYHNAIFYENKIGSIKIKSEWSLDDPEFEIKMLRYIMDNLPNYYNSKQNIGIQRNDQGTKFKNWKDFYILLNNRMNEDFDLESPNEIFINKGELCNYLAYKFIAVVKTVFEHREF